MTGPEAWEAAAAAIAEADLIVDAVLGTGLREAPTGLAAAAIAWMRARHDSGVPVVAVDLPSGVPSDGGAFDWPAVRRDAHRDVRGARSAVTCCRPRPATAAR